MTDTNEKLNFSCDYLEGAHERILKRLSETNLQKMDGYGYDPCSESARARIREACSCPKAEVQFLIGGTQANAVMIDAMLQSYQGVISASSGHVNVHEAGAIEAGGHKVLALPQHNGKIAVSDLERYLTDFEQDSNRDHMVMPGMVYLSQPTEYGTLYTLQELEAIHDLCHSHQVKLYVDGARLAYALASPANDVTLLDLARLCDAFYIGGTKCGALIGEAVVVPEPDTIPHLFTIIKQHGALLAKGRLTGIQFDELFRDGLYFTIGKSAVDYAGQIQKALTEKGYRLLFESPTNQVYLIVPDDKLPALGEAVVYSFWEKYDEAHTVIRLSTSWASTQEEVERLISIL
ncbi:MAG: aminotransferase class I/II-fold pyridoxal phosphate-dependent enzyme [Eubacteriaceae bacterium]|jgi:threonine aldolase|uniref:Aminotransferase class I/II-fold pyridoxal phosphate-dependent enzyme n=1 Tax=Candidatus Pseudoramibacter fermentans TaxID=2594427 RepID=A0A6L5GPF5_9FIRM|nr:aminotransferase class I/II-fold pyridoxal phosphate-dependent enzyme [Candidatus Pseudoramibacter fermentans]RRF92396.1 MAG: aminotransferase class I/II-fold pyridoxal phosphate-dependent enzyme [Eubacteriaceae bacterium]